MGYVQKAGGTHPIGMHSCFKLEIHYICVFFLNLGKVRENSRNGREFFERKEVGTLRIIYLNYL